MKKSKQKKLAKRQARARAIQKARNIRTNNQKSRGPVKGRKNKRLWAKLMEYAMLKSASNKKNDDGK
jgi:hypothetical protein